MSRINRLKEYVNTLLPSRKGSADPAESNLINCDVDAAPAAVTDHLSPLSREFLEEIENLSTLFKQNDPCPHVTINDFLAPEFCEQMISEFPDCDADAMERFKANNLRGGQI